MNFKSKKGILSWILLGCFFAIVISELIVRIVGITPYRYNVTPMEVTPKGYVVSDPVLGFRAAPGVYRINFNNGLYSTTTHWKDGSRATREQEEKEAEFNLFIYGCSFAYGFNLNDSMTMAWHIQEQLPQANVRNYSFIGYGMNQAYLAMKAHVEEGKIPHLAIVNYASFQDERHVLTDSYKSKLSVFSKGNERTALQSSSWPVYSLDAAGKLQLKYSSLEHKPWPLVSTSALVRLIWDFRNSLEFKKKDPQEVTFALISAMQELSVQHNFTLLVTGISRDAGTREILHRCAQMGMRTIDISVDPSIKENTLYPYDVNHPSATANEFYANRILEYLN